MSREEVAALVASLVPSQNLLYAIRLIGSFDIVRTRTVARQDPPYRPLIEVTRGEQVRQWVNISGTIAGFRTPAYERGIGVPGGHVRFIDDARQGGGHVLDFTTRRASLELCVGTDLHLALPLTRAFARADLAGRDIDREVEATERHR